MKLAITRAFLKLMHAHYIVTGPNRIFQIEIVISEVKQIFQVQAEDSNT